MNFGAISELGKLQKVLMHRPGLEILNVTKETLSHYRFKGVPDLEKMQEEFDAFTAVLKEEGVQIFLLEDLIEDTSMPNLLFTRDIAAIMDVGLVVMNMAIPGRDGEPLIAKKALERRIPVAVEIFAPGYLEGGELVFIDEKTLAVGYGPRSNLGGITQLLEGLKLSQIEEIVSVHLPPYRVHLDGGFMVVAPNLCVLHEPTVRHDVVHINRSGEIRTEPFIDYLKKKNFEWISVTDEEARNFGPNMFAVEAEKVISYDWNTRIIAELETHGVDVISIAGQELVKGAGGPHCMTCPLLRSPI